MAGDGKNGGGGRYALALDEVEVERYRLMAEQARASEAALWRLAGIVEGAYVADVGCGPGALLPALADAVTPTGRVSGIDGDPGAVAAARALVAAAGLANVTVAEGRADRTGLEPESLDAVMVRHVLAHNGGGEDAIVTHLATLLRPGGCLYLLDSEGTAIRMVPDDPDLADLSRRYLEFHARRGNDVQAGLRLAERLSRAGLEVLEYRGTYIIRPMPPGLRPPSWAAREAMVAAGVATEGDLDRWASAFERLDAATTRPTLFVPAFVAVGRCPSTTSDAAAAERPAS
jgi:SAM-dependent methyltransferase